MIKKILSILVLTMSTAALAQTLIAVPPTKVIIPFQPGGGVDHVFRLMQKYAESQNIVLVPDYRPGANGQIGIQHAINDQTPDDTLLLTIISDVARHTDHIKPVSALAKSTVLIVASNRSQISDITQLAKGSYSWGYGSSPMEAVARGMAQDSPNNILVPFNGAGSVMAALVSNSIDLAVLPATAGMSLLNSKYVKVIAVYDDHSNMYPGLAKVEDRYRINLLNDGFGLFMSRRARPESAVFWEKFTRGFINDPMIVAELKARALYPMASNSSEYLAQLVRNFVLVAKL